MNRLAQFAIIGSLLSNPCVHAAPPIELEVITQGGAAPLTSHEWARALQDLPVESVRIRSDVKPIAAEVIPIGDGEDRRYRVVAVLQSGDLLIVPGDQFRRTEMGRFREWLDSLDQRHAGPDAEYAFGLTATQLIEVTDALSIPVSIATKDQKVRSVLARLNQEIGPRMKLAPSAKGKIVAEDIVMDELNGISAGTAIASILRPFGLVMIPQVPVGKSTAAKTTLLIADVREAEESWPVGWPRETGAAKMVPKWMEFVEVTIDQVALAGALDVFQKRLEIPFLIDHNGMLRARINPQTVRVSYPGKRMVYGRVVRSLLGQAKLRGEIRADEAGKPFLWISPITSN